MEEARLALYLRLFHRRALGPALFSRLLHAVGSVDQLLGLEEVQLLEYGLTPTQIEALRKCARTVNSRGVDRDLEWHRKSGQTIVCYEHPNYPPLLKEIDVAPPLLFVRGNVGALNHPQVAIVGSRQASSYGLRNAYWMAHEISRAGVTISSGMARGIDTRAHQGALAAKRSTIAVIGTGADITYPGSNQNLGEDIAEHGAIVSEFALGTPPLPENFPRRNRIMSGLSLGTLVVEAAHKSGTLITARLALEQNREVFAIPGLISNALTAGCHQLIVDGARLVQHPNDVLQELGVPQPPAWEGDRDAAPKPASTARPRVMNKQDPITTLIGDQGCELQYLLDQSSLDYQLLLKRLLELEMEGQIRASGGRYYRVNLKE